MAFEECDQFPAGSRKRAICDGSATDLPLWKRNRYRVHWGLDPIEGEEEFDRNVVHSPQVVYPKKTVKGAVRNNIKYNSFIGEYVQEAIKRDVKIGTPCSSCKAAIRKLNSLTPDEVEARKTEIAKDIESRAVESAPNWWMKVGVWVDQHIGTGMTHEKVISWIDEAIHRARQGRPKPVVRPKNPIPTPAILWRARNEGAIDDEHRGWAVGIITCTSRLDTILPRSIESLVESGFEVDRIFVDGKYDKEDYYGIPTTVRTTPIGPHGNTILGIQELFFRYRYARRFAIFQDDFVSVKNLRAYLETQEIPDKGWWNLFNHPTNEKLGAETEDRWFKGNQLGHGSVGIVFDNSTIVDLLSSKQMVDWVVNENFYPTQIDFSIARVLNKIGYTEFCHQPSLLQHTGVNSTLRLKKWSTNLSRSFPGEEFDALSLLEERE